MSKTTTTQAFHELIMNMWKAMRVYNTQGSDQAINVLATIREQIDTVIHHLKNS